MFVPETHNKGRNLNTLGDAEYFARFVYILLFLDLIWFTHRGAFPEIYLKFHFGANFLMDALDQFLAAIKSKSLHLGRFLGLLHLLVAYKITTDTDQLVSQGLTFRDLAQRLKKSRWNPEDIESLGLNAKDLPQRDRLRFWFVVLVRCDVTSQKAALEAETLSKAIRKIGYQAVPPAKA